MSNVQCLKSKVTDSRISNYDLRIQDPTFKTVDSRISNFDFTRSLYQIRPDLLKTRCLRHPRATLSTAPGGANIRVSTIHCSLLFLRLCTIRPEMQHICNVTMNDYSHLVTATLRSWRTYVTRAL